MCEHGHAIKPIKIYVEEEEEAAASQPNKSDTTHRI